MNKVQYKLVPNPNVREPLEIPALLKYLERRITLVQNNEHINGDYQHGVTSTIADVLFELGYTLQIERYN